MEQPINVATTTESKFAALPARIGSALALVVVAGSCLHAGGGVWLGFMAFCAIVMLYEWFGLTKTFTLGWKIAGIAYVALPLISLYFLQHTQITSTENTHSDGTSFIITLIAMVAATDIGAYFSGKLMGGAKLAPRISPNKTWAGLIGGAICASIVSLLFHHVFMNSVFAVLLGMLIAIFGQTGDIFESWLKRRAGVKDSGKILPGHGGLLDRFDGYTLTAPFYLNVLIYLYGAQII